MSWPSALLPEAVIFGLLAAVSGGVLGGAIGRALAPPVEDLAPSPRWAVIARRRRRWSSRSPSRCRSPSGENVSAQVTLTEVAGAAGADASTPRSSSTPPDAADDAEWFKATSWQGGGSIVADMREVSPGVYRTTKPIPVYGNWKSTLRLHKGDVVAGLPIFLPEDTAIPAKEVPAEAQMTREFVLDKKNLQREQKQDVPGLPDHDRLPARARDRDRDHRRRSRSGCGGWTATATARREGAETGSRAATDGSDPAARKQSAEMTR